MIIRWGKHSTNQPQAATKKKKCKNLRTEYMMNMNRTISIQIIQIN